MKKLFCIIMIAVTAMAWTSAKESRTAETTSPQGYYCPNCDVQLHQALVKVGEKRCRQCNGKGWYGYGRTKDACRRNGTLCDPCNYCGGRGVQPIKDYRWVCPRCQVRYRI
ncbi:MAG: hypothetical protein NC344_09140 [Bacteroidales bacterium]|nr:hypothetical protein [Bacteroidales bacterium]MCM1147974.1 hypothetical protein [Bacteroidales bacterium]MCM1206898.1 hypothetical protein [Bacillota bacterium]MCM1509531.1 hypothetical protein [Clostridium sp.]